MSKIKNIAETKDNLETADLVFMIDLDTGSQHISLSEKFTVPDGLTAPFRLAVHLNGIIEEALKAQENEGQEGEAVAEATETEN